MAYMVEKIGMVLVVELMDPRIFSRATVNLLTNFSNAPYYWQEYCSVSFGTSPVQILRQKGWWLGFAKCKEIYIVVSCRMEKHLPSK
eukprot:15355602-Ditylum_brightwellii.AAC.1